MVWNFTSKVINPKTHVFMNNQHFFEVLTPEASKSARLMKWEVIRPDKNCYETCLRRTTTQSSIGAREVLKEQEIMSLEWNEIYFVLFTLSFIIFFIEDKPRLCNVETNICRSCQALCKFHQIWCRNTWEAVKSLTDWHEHQLCLKLCRISVFFSFSHL